MYCNYSCCLELDNYNTISYSLIALTFVNIIVIRLYFLRDFKLNPSLTAKASVLNNASKYLVLVSVVKIIGGALLMTYFLPRSCTDQGIRFVSYYPYICFTLGLLWLLRAKSYHIWASKLSNARQPLIGSVIVSAEPPIAYAVSQVPDPQNMA